MWVRSGQGSRNITKGRVYKHISLNAWGSDHTNSQLGKIFQKHLIYLSVHKRLLLTIFDPAEGGSDFFYFFKILSVLHYI
jgi:hypothetical protein